MYQSRAIPTMGNPLATTTGHSSYVTALHQANLELFSASADGSVRVTDIRTGNSRTILDTKLGCFSVYHRVDGFSLYVCLSHTLSLSHSHR